MRNLKKSKNYVLALNRAWLPVDIITYKDAFRLMCKGHAKGLETVNGSYMMHTMESWMDMHMTEQFDEQSQYAEQFDTDGANEYETLSTVSMEIPVPEIIILHDYNKIPQRFVKFSKGNLLIRDDYECAYCGCSLDMDTSTIDHIQPSSKGGETSWENCTSACKKCNHNKGDALPVGKFKPKKKAKEPTTSSPIYQMKKKAKDIKMPESWKKFLFH